jgi:hypothetical protein
MKIVEEERRTSPTLKRNKIKQRQEKKDCKDQQHKLTENEA